ncbi:MAG: FtsH protease activity modulator HflK [Alphaproteobacteria bacterium]|nr:FtsH protease activity modulator HflK [Alphaproteobacteria bacterium]
MPWNNQGGGWQPGGGRGPWGQGPSQGGGGGSGGGGGGRGPQSPDLEDLLRRGQERFKRVLPGGPRSPRAFGLIILGFVALWLVSGFFQVAPDEQGVVLRFGKWVRTTDPGLHYHLPSPIEEVLKPKVTRVNREDIGFRTVTETRRGREGDLLEESLMLTGDENIVDLRFSVLWVIRDAGQFLFNIQDPAGTVKAASESAMREVVGRNKISYVLAEGRAPIEAQTRDLIQRIVDQYGAGVRITEAKLQRADPPGQVIDAFRDVQRARADLERQRNEAEAYQNDIVPRAKGDAERLIQEAEAYKEQVILTARGDAQRFLSIYKEYKGAREVTARRMYLETMERVLGGMNKVIIDQDKGGGGVVPYLPLNELMRQRPAPTSAGGQQ